jgi:hypothetical protein
MNSSISTAEAIYGVKNTRQNDNELHFFFIAAGTDFMIVCRGAEET